jgi:hypothetical protein
VGEKKKKKRGRKSNKEKIANKNNKINQYYQPVPSAEG